MKQRDTILQLVRDRSSVSSSELAGFLGVTRQTAHHHLAALVQTGDLARTGRGRATRYVLSPTTSLPTIARELEDEARQSTHLQLVGKPLRQRTAGPEDPLAPLVWAFDYMVLSGADERYEQHGPFAPMLETSEGQYPPPLSEVPDRIVALWEKLSELVTHPYLRARLHDLMWERRWSARPDLHARSAIDAYLVLADVASGLEYAEALIRAAEIARSISDEERRALVAEAGLDRADEELASPGPKPGIVLRLLDAAFLNPEDAVPLRLLALLDRAKRTFGDPWIQEEIFQRQLALSRDDQERAQELRRQSIERWRREANAASGIKRRFFLTRALEQAHIYRFGEVAEELRREVQDLEFDEAEMQSVSAEVELPRDHLERTIEWISSGEDWQTCLGRIAALGPLSGSWNRNLETVRRQAAEFPLQRLFPSHVVGPWNETLFIASSEDEKTDLDLSRHEAVAIAIASYAVADALDRIHGRHGSPLRPQLQVFFTTPVIDGDNAERMAASVEHFTRGRFDECVMVVLPRIEDTIRDLVRHVGAPVWWEPQPSRRYGIQRPLGQLLGQLKGLLDEDWRRYFITLLINPLGPNLRNVYLHGLAGRGTREHAAALIHVATSLALIQLSGRANGDTDTTKDT